MAPPTGGGSCGVGDGGELAAELLDECWYFRNVLGGKPVGIPARLAVGGHPPSPSDPEKEAVITGGLAGEGPAAVSPLTLPGERAPAHRSLLRTPSLPPRVGRGKPASHEGACPHKPAGPKLRHSYSNLESVLPFSPNGSQPHLSRKGASNGAAARQRPPCDPRVESIINYVNSHHRAITGEGCRRSFRVKKWRSLSDLEVEEAQGFRDLGFVFDTEELSPGVLEVIPGLRDRRAAEGGSGGKGVRRPYLSEAWLVQGSAPPALDWVDGRSSAADVKEQLRFWARVVASNVRQEC